MPRLLVGVGLALSLGLDTLTVAVALGLAGLPRSSRWRLALAVGTAEGLMPLVGLGLGHLLAATLARLAQVVAGLALLAIALNEGRELARGDDEEAERTVRRVALGGSLWGYAAAGLAVSLDELAAGVGLGVVRVPWQLVIPWVAVQGYALTWAGLSWGSRLGESFEHWTGRLTVAAFAVLGLFFLAQAAGLISI